MKNSNRNKIHINPHNIEDLLSVPEDLDVEEFKAWIEHQPNVFLTRKLNTLLFNAVFNNNYQIAEFLLENSADPNSANCYGQSILHHAVEKRNHKLINLLLEKGANPNLQQEYGETPMHIAASNGDYKVMKLLLLYNANPMLLTDEGRSALDYAREKGHTKCIEVLSQVIVKKRSATRRISYEGNVDRVRSKESPSKLKNQGDVNQQQQFTTLLENFSSKNSRNNPSEGRNVQHVQQSAFVKREDMKDTGLNINPNISTVSNTNNLSRITHERNYSQNLQSQILRKFGEYFDSENENSEENQSKKSNLHDSLSNQANILEDKLNKKIQDLMSKIKNSDGEEMNINDTSQRKDESVGHQKENVNLNLNLNLSEHHLHSNDANDQPQSPEFTSKNVQSNKQSKLQTNNLPAYLNYENLVNSHKSRKKLLSNDKIMSLHKEESNACGHKESVSSISIRTNDENRQIPLQQTFSIDNTYEAIPQNTPDAANTRITNSVTKQGPFCLMNGFTVNHMGTIGNSSIGDDIFNQRDSIQQGGGVNQNCSNDYDNYNSYLKYCDLFHDQGKVLAIFMSAKNDIIEFEREAVMKNTSSNPLRNSNVSNVGNIFETQRKINELMNLNFDQVNEFVNECRTDEQSEEEVQILEGEDEEISEEKEEDEENENENELLDSKGDDFKVTGTDDDIPSYTSLNKKQSSEQKHDEKKNINEIDEISVTIFQRTPRSYESRKQKDLNDEVREVRDFLKSIGLEEFTKVFVEHGFDDIKLVIEQMKTGTGISDANLRDAGISLPGDRAKILIKLEEESKILDYPLPHGKVYYKPPSRMKDYLTDTHVQSIHKWLSTLKLEQYTINFAKAGYYSIELLFIQMLSQNPLTETMLEKEIDIKKIGYRVRILNKLRDDSKAYLNKLKNTGIINVDRGREIQGDSCKCQIF